MGLRRSNLVSAELEDAKQGNTLTRTTMSLFYATDFFDQLVHEIIPALRAGLIVLADRYIYTLMARDIVRGADHAWTRNLYSPALVPDAVFYFRVSARQLVERNFQKNATLDYWESGMDLGLSRDMFDSFMKFQRMLAVGVSQDANGVRVRSDQCEPARGTDPARLAQEDRRAARRIYGESGARSAAGSLASDDQLRKGWRLRSILAPITEGLHCRPPLWTPPLRPTTLRPRRSTSR